jgi:hypothetical protein
MATAVATTHALAAIRIRGCGMGPAWSARMNAR